MESDMQNEIKNLWRIKPVNQQSILELRAINQQGAISRIFKASNYSSTEELCLAFENEALRLNDMGYNIYVPLNEIRPDFSGDSVGDKDILYRTLLLIDIDRVDSKNPANEIELEEARLLAFKVSDFLSNSGWQKPQVVMSGNGYHLYYQMDNLPNDDEVKTLVQSFLKKLAAKFDNSLVKIDTSVFNASRITKVVGTVARKGKSSEDRPYRMAKLV